MRPKIPKGVWGYLMIPLVIVLDLVYYYLDDVLDHGHAIAYLNSYGQGWLTWWWDFQPYISDNAGFLLGFATVFQQMGL